MRRCQTDAVPAEQMRRADELEPDAVSRLAVERRRHPRPEPHLLTTVVDGDVDEHLVPEVLDRPDRRAQRPVADPQRLRAEADRDVPRTVGDGGLSARVERELRRAEPKRAIL